MKPYDWMVKFTPQTEWIKGRGILLWLAFYFIELGAGTYFVGSFFNNLEAMIIGWLMCGVLGGGLHLIYLGRPSRVYRIFAKPQSSWISRGMYFVSLFMILGFFDIYAVYQDTPNFTLHVIANIFAFLEVIYGGFAMCAVNGIPLWNTALIPALYVVSGLWGGAGVTLGVVLAFSAGFAPQIGVWAHMLLISFAVLLAIYLISLNYGSSAAKKSLVEIVKGAKWYVFWGIVVILGIVIPLLFSLSNFESMAKGMLYLIIVFELVGDLAMRYLILENGFYKPLVPSTV